MHDYRFYKRATIKVPYQTHQSIKVIAAALRIRQVDVVDRAVAHYRLRHADRIRELTSARSLGDLSELSPDERVALAADQIKERMPGSTVWAAVEGRLVTLVCDPLPADWTDLMFDLHDMLGLEVYMLDVERAPATGCDPARDPFRRL